MASPLSSDSRYQLTRFLVPKDPTTHHHIKTIVPPTTICTDRCDFSTSDAYRATCKGRLSSTSSRPTATHSEWAQRGCMATRPRNDCCSSAYLPPPATRVTSATRTACKRSRRSARVGWQTIAGRRRRC